MKCLPFSRKFIQYLGGDIRNLTILLLLSLLTPIWGTSFDRDCPGACCDGDENCGACCYSTPECWVDWYTWPPTPSLDPNREGCETKCVQVENENSCNLLPAPLGTCGAYCYQTDSVHMSEPHYILGSQGVLGGRTCGLYRPGACCTQGWHATEGNFDQLDSNGWSITGYSCTEEFNGISFPQDCLNGNGLGCYDSNNDGYDDASYIAGLEEGILLGGQGGDSNGDGVLNVLDIVIFVEMILNP